MPFFDAETSHRMLQALSVPALTNGGSFLLASHTGSGKTLAYLLPVVQRLKLQEQREQVGRRIRSADLGRRCRRLALHTDCTDTRTHQTACQQAHLTCATCDTQRLHIVVPVTLCACHVRCTQTAHSLTA